MWKVSFKELRAFTNSLQLSISGLNVNPMELNDIYEHVWNVGLLLQTNQCMSILDQDFRPWPKVSSTSCSSLYLLRNPTSTVQGARGRGKQY
jgi:hypothetical protein